VNSFKRNSRGCLCELLTTDNTNIVSSHSVDYLRDVKDVVSKLNGLLSSSLGREREQSLVRR
jgi:hypothetical protein